MTSLPRDPAATSSLGRPQPPPSLVDRVVTIVLIVATAASAALGSLVALSFFFIGDGCNIPGGTTCDSRALSLGILVSAVGTWVPVIALGAVAIVRMTRRRRSWWVALVGTAAAVGVWVIGAAVALSSSPSFTL